MSLILREEIRVYHPNTTEKYMQFGIRILMLSKSY